MNERIQDTEKKMLRQLNYNLNAHILYNGSEKKTNDIKIWWKKGDYYLCVCGVYSSSCSRSYYLYQQDYATHFCATSFSSIA